MSLPQGREPAGISHPWPDPPAPGQAVQIADGVLWLRLPLPMALDHVNVFAFADDVAEGGGWTVIDTGFDTRRSRAIWETALAGPLAGRPVTRIIATHHHPDHIGLAGWFMAQGSDLWTSRTAWLMARMLVLDEQGSPPPETLTFWRRAGMPAALLAERAGQRPFNFADTVHPLPLGYTRLTEGQRVRFGGRDWRVTMGDGHAPEHVTLWSLSDDLVIGGDQLLPGISPNLGVYPTEPQADPVGDWLAACHRLSALARPGHLVLPGHKLPFAGLPLRLTQMVQNHERALDRLASALAERPRSAAECFPALYRREIGAGEYGLALVEAVAHLNRLAVTGRAQPVGERDGAVLWGVT
ncbi:MAG: MBL fold metallo-hydrolase [Paracoccus sp. (in: a-proteobacteria)]|uniref:MBL fold metallo-hydrolase n=1 Tax=Paracoccus sp. TaxID=267 RepID=UPI0026DEF44D|nr:MBL fold metallo-hydrolase [Paracoccus sp. (in: a-proteobacteria)]MDO5632485.1 MBL fold metallo-hydrolase [Paracoccus sp. (in: a-proteobacteria)]